jgi:protein-L-isoaspartate(D-aspartate) O-methyltransferase
MFDFAAARTRMVDGQLRPNEVTDWSLLEAMSELPREAFVPAAMRELAYVDVNLPLTAGGEGGRALLQPMVIARMIQAAEVVSSDVVLDVGCASGYAAAILSRLAGSVVALEEDAALAADAGAVLARLGADNAVVVTGPLARGCPAEAPFDVILLEGAVEMVPEALVSQLRDGGRLVVVEGTGGSGEAMLYRRTGAEVSGSRIMNASLPPLPGFARPRVFQF